MAKKAKKKKDVIINDIEEVKEEIQEIIEEEVLVEEIKEEVLEEVVDDEVEEILEEVMEKEIVEKPKRTIGSLNKDELRMFQRTGRMPK